MISSPVSAIYAAWSYLVGTHASQADDGLAVPMDKLFDVLENADVETFLYLLSMHAGVDLAQCNAEGKTLLHVAADDGNHEAIEALLSTGRLDVNVCAAHAEAGKFTNMTPLMFAVKGGHMDAIRVLIEAGAKVNATNYAGDTALIIGAAHGCDRPVLALIAAGAHTFIANHRGDTALIAASRFDVNAAILALPELQDHSEANISARDRLISDMQRRPVKIVEA